MTIWQDRAQIRNLYRESERTLISNHTTTLWLPGSQDLDTLKLLSDLIGDQWVAAATVSAAPDGGLSVSEGSERFDVAPPAFLRTLKHGAAVMLTGNTPPALISTHAYFDQHRWRRLIADDQLQHHAAMHGGGGPTTASQWEEKDWADTLPEPAGHADTASRSNGHTPTDRGSLGRILEAHHPPVLCNRRMRSRWGPGGLAIPDQLRGEPGQWTTVRLPEEVALAIGQDQVDLTNPYERRRVLPYLLEIGPPDLVASIVTFPQLRTEWLYLELSEPLRDGWESCYPGLADDITWEHPSVAAGVRT